VSPATTGKIVTDPHQSKFPALSGATITAEGPFDIDTHIS
jgi:hypothetical protein